MFSDRFFFLLLLFASRTQEIKKNDGKINQISAKRDAIPTSDCRFNTNLCVCTRMKKKERKIAIGISFYLVCALILMLIRTKTNFPQHFGSDDKSFDEWMKQISENQIYEEKENEKNLYERNRKFRYEQFFLRASVSARVPLVCSVLSNNNIVSFLKWQFRREQRRKWSHKIVEIFSCREDTRVRKTQAESEQKKLKKRWREWWCAYYSY